MFEAGAWVLLESALADLPADLRWLYEAGAVTISQLAAMYDALGVTSVADLAVAVNQHAIRSVPGLDEAVEREVGASLSSVRRSMRRISLGRGVGLAEPFLARLRSLDAVEWAVAAGSLRRGQESIGDVDLVVATSDPAAASEAATAVRGVDRVLQRTSKRVYVLVNQAQVGIRFYDPSVAGSALLYLTGSPAHFDALRARAGARGWQLSADGLRDGQGRVRSVATEEEIYAALGLPFIPPEIRDGEREIEAAERGALPAFLTVEDIRGDLHMHSVWSDGHDTIERMVQGCRDLGYEYVAITDHSPHAGAARALSVQAVTRQRDEIAALRERYPDIVILHGCEVDILPEGRLDFPDRVLEQFDIVLASLHDRAGHGPEQLLQRYVSAMRHPLVTVITHPTNRLVLHRAGYNLDYDRLFEAAVETGTVLEVDGAPAHLDMDGALAKRAIAAGAGVVVDSDSHRAEFLGWQMRFGVMTARRGWVEPRHVLNTRPIAEVRQAIHRKRSA